MEYTRAKMPEKNDTVVVGMSGGVDSTLTALLLKKNGCNVIGATMSLWDGTLPEGIPEEQFSSSCFGPNEEKNIAECSAFCMKHGIEYHVIDVKEAYKKNVLEYFKSEYRSGRTPNPCIRCNQTVKFGAFLEGIQNSGIAFDYFCTGHYADVVIPNEGVFGTDKKPFMIANACDAAKDQTYFLYRLHSDTLAKVRFPLAGITKAHVFELAEEAHLEAAARKESQDFLSPAYFDILFNDKKSVPGDIIDLDGNVIGRHRGIEHYTIGQRRGLGVALNYPVYVQAIDEKNNVIVLAPNDALNSESLIADNFVWPGDIPPDKPFTALAKIRLASKPARATIEQCPAQDKNSCESVSYKITFETPQRAVAPGQSVVLYKDNVIIGGGIIKKAEHLR